MQQILDDQLQNWNVENHESLIFDIAVLAGRHPPPPASPVQTATISAEVMKCPVACLTFTIGLHEE
jgi:hypothetical protein